MDDGWKVVEVEPEAVETYNGVNGNGHHADGIGPTVELVLDTGHYANGNGHAAVEVNGNGHSDEAPEPQQSLFSWAEFMAEEPVKPKGRKPQASARHPLDVRVGADRGTGAGGRSRSARHARPQHTGGGRRYVSDGLPLHGHAALLPFRPRIAGADSLSAFHVCGPFLLSKTTATR